MAIGLVLDGGAFVLQAAYTPYVLTIIDDGSTGVPPVIYCDVYFDGTYYKTVTTQSIVVTVGGDTFWQVDISGLAQEYLKTKIIDITTGSLPAVYLPPGTIGSGTATLYGQCQCYCRVRNSTIDSYGVVTPGGTPPVQATVDSPAVAGDGYQSNTFYFVNAALQITDPTSMEADVESYRVKIFPGTVVNVSNKVYPLSYASKLRVYKNDWGMFPIISLNKAFITTSGMATSIIGNLRLAMYDNSSSLIYAVESSPITVYSDSIYLLPYGVPNLIAIFPLMAPFIDACTVYYVSFINVTNSPGAATVVSTPPIYIEKDIDGVIPGVTSLLQGAIVPITPPLHTRLWFQNYLGQFDAWNFIERIESHKVTSTPTEKGVNVAPTGFNRSLIGMSRNNIRGNDESTVTGLFNESDLPFIKQLLDSAKGFIEFTSPDGSSPAALMLPIVITDASYDTQSWDDRYEYRISVKYVLSNEYKVVRN